MLRDVAKQLRKPSRPAAVRERDLERAHGRIAALEAEIVQLRRALNDLWDALAIADQRSVDA